MSNMLDAALDYHRRGCSIIPIAQGTKRPACRGWKEYQQTPADERTIVRWFGNDKANNVALIMGPVSGDLASRDFDTTDSYHTWAAEHHKLASTLPTVETGRGYHVYFRCPASERTVKKFTDGELRWSGCYNLAPASLHPSGKAYSWLVPLVDELPRVDDLAAACFLAADLVAAAGLTAGNLGGCNREDQRDLKTWQEEVGGDHPTTNPNQTCPKYSQLSLESLASLLHDKRLLLAIQRTLPSGYGSRHAAVFAFVRELKALPELALADPKQLKPIVRARHQAALPYMTTKAFEETWLDFVEGWPKAKFPKGEEPIRMLYQQAVEAALPEAAMAFEQVELRQFVAFCRVLQQASGDQPFYLSTRAAGGLFGVSHVQVARWLRMLTLEEILRLESRGSLATNKASRFRYLAI